MTITFIETLNIPGITTSNHDVAWIMRVYVSSVWIVPENDQEMCEAVWNGLAQP